jgi:uncharacterized short protein YbdD (DUF466 family)
MSEQELYSLVGKLVAFIASGAGGAFLFAKFWGQKWIENKFSKDLEQFRAQTLHEFSILLTRKTKWHDKEHEVLSECWKKLVQAHRALKKAISMMRNIPNLDNYNDANFSKFLDENDFNDSEKKYLRDNNSKRNNAYLKILETRSVDEAHKAFLEFHNYCDENKIFLRPHIKEQFDIVNQHIWEAWVSKHMDVSHSEGNKDFLWKAYDKESKEIKPLINEIETAIQKELFPEDILDKEKG